MTVDLIILAAGLSSRMGERDKLRLSFDGESLIVRVISAATASSAGNVVLVTGADDYADLVADSRIERVSNPDYRSGMASSIRAGVRASHAEVYGILLGDMPFLQSQTIARIARNASPEAITIPFHHARPGHPVFFGSRFRPDLLALSGDVGARSIITRHAEAAVRVDLKDPGILQDIDTEAAYVEARREG